jgi:anti-sigma factor RsiW
MSPHTHDDAWLAVQYVLGELSADERTRFESRLADDANLCQHVADAAVLLTTAQATSPSVTQVAPRIVPRRSLVAVTAVAAAALCLVLAVLPRDERPAQTGGAAKLVKLWRGQADTLSSDGDDFDAIDDHSEWAADQVPSWMIAAVSLERKKHAPGETPQDEWEEN